MQKQVKPNPRKNEERIEKPKETVVIIMTDKTGKKTLRRL
jgi:hypothetical protein